MNRIGPGEKQLESDRRQMKSKISLLNRAIDSVRRHRSSHRTRRYTSFSSSFSSSSSYHSLFLLPLRSSPYTHTHRHPFHHIYNPSIHTNIPHELYFFEVLILLLLLYTLRISINPPYQFIPTTPSTPSLSPSPQTAIGTPSGGDGWIYQRRQIDVIEQFHECRSLRRGHALRHIG